MNKLWPIAQGGSWLLASVYPRGLHLPPANTEARDYSEVEDQANHEAACH